MTVTEILAHLASTSSKNEKEAILKSHADNSLLKRVFEVTYSKTLNFFVRQFSVDDLPEGAATPLEKSIELLVTNIGGRVYTGDDAKSYMSQLVQTCVEPETLLKVINRDLECGIQTTLTNKVWKDLIMDPPYMSYRLYKPDLVKKLKFPAYSDVKQDGLYADVLVYSDKVVYRSRSGKLLNFRVPDKVEKRLMKQAFDCDQCFVMHSEALVIDAEYRNGVQPREIGNGYLNQDPDAIDSDKVKLIAWDVVTMEEYDNRKSDIPYRARRSALKEIIHFVDTPEHLEIIEGRIIENVKEIIDHFIECRENRLEGTVVKSCSLLWEDKKVSQGIKLKNEFDVEVEVYDFVPHKKKEGWIGSLLVKSSDGKFDFGVGSGLTDKLRQIPFEEWKGAIITVKANDISRSETKDTLSLFLPRFIERRNDKTTANSSEEIFEAADSILIQLRNLAGVTE